MNTTPTVSVVVASFSEEAALVRCLESLEAYARMAEHVVATNLRPEAVARLTRRFPGARLFCFPSGTDVFRLRSLGVTEARGRLIAMIEDHCTVGPDWLAALAQAHLAGHTVIGGPVGNGLTRWAYHWALYLCEYGPYMPPLPAGPVVALSAVNTAYDREALWNCRPVWEDGFHDNEVHDALRAAGHSLYLEGKACVSTYLAMMPGEAVRHLFAGGRRFGGYRRSRSTPGQRLLWVLAAPAIPLLLLGRIVRRVAVRRPQRLRDILLWLPHLCYLVGAWSAGEALGYLAREPPALSRRSERRDEPRRSSGTGS